MVGSKRFKFGLLCTIIVALILLGLLPPNNPMLINVAISLQGPSLEYPGGTDRLGRCLFSQAAQGILWSFFLASLAGLISLTLGLVWVGLMRAGKWRGFDTFGRIPILAFKALPPFLVALSLASLAQGEDWAAVVALALFSWPFLAQVLNDEIAWVLHQPHLDGARTLGGPKRYILRVHVMSLAWPRIMRYVILDLVGLIALEAVFGFVGLSNPERPSLGYMLYLAKDYLTQYPWLFLTPLAFLLAGVLSLSVIALAMIRSDDSIERLSY